MSLLVVNCPFTDCVLGLVTHKLAALSIDSRVIPSAKGAKSFDMVSK
jgi:hypothetical protein